MRIRVALEDDEVVDDWEMFRVLFDEAADRLDLEITQVIHTDLEYL